MGEPLKDGAVEGAVRRPFPKPTIIDLGCNHKCMEIVAPQIGADGLPTEWIRYCVSYETVVCAIEGEPRGEFRFHLYAKPSYLSATSHRHVKTFLRKYGLDDFKWQACPVEGE